MIEEFFKEKINGFSQYFYVEGPSEISPLILFVHGGPGVSNSSICAPYKNLLKKDFLVIHWDQRGTWNSFDRNINYDNLKITDFVNDLRDVTHFLKAKYKKNKIILSGHSWGSILTVLYGFTSPNDVELIINVGQAVNTEESENLIYSYLLEKAKSQNNSEAVKELSELGAPPHKTLEQISITRKWSAFNGGSFKDYKSFTEGVEYFLKLSRPEYLLTEVSESEYDKSDPSDKIVGVLWPQILELNLFRHVISQVPFVLCHSKNDLHTIYSVAKNWFDQVDVSSQNKEFHEFLESGHMTHFDEPKKFSEIVNSAFKRYC